MNSYYKELSPFGVSKPECEILIERYGLYGAIDLLKSCPYLITLDPGMDFRGIDGYIMKKTGVSATCPARIAHALLYTLYACERGAAKNAEDRTSFDERIAETAGSTCIAKGDMYDLIEELLGLEEGSISLPLLDKCIKHLALTGKISVNRIGNQVFLATKSAYTAEKEAAELVSSKLAASAKPRRLKSLYKAIDSAMAATGKILSQEQKSAVAMILQNKLSVLTGGPGTGKTQTELVLIQALRYLDPSATVRCIAPTGQAARRMTDATGCPATTIHKALNIIPGSNSESDSSLSESLIICDEASMIDAFLFRDLMKSLSDSSTIVFVGDVAQLPSVGAGNVLAELIASESVPVTRLTKIFRQGDNSIAFNCAKIQSSNPRLDLDASFEFIERTSSNAISKEVVSLYKEEAEKNGVDSVVVLTPYRRSTKTGVNRLNDALRSALKDTSSLSYCKNPSGVRIYTGDKITFLRNRDGLVNGETGTAVKCFSGTAVCRFGDKEITLTGDDLDFIEPAFAQTVHKSQGLEYPTCIIVIDEKHMKMLSQEIIYTAISRSKKRCVCVGFKSLLERAINGSGTKNVRSSCLAHLIDRVFAKKEAAYA